MLSPQFLLFQSCTNITSINHSYTQNLLFPIYGIVSQFPPWLTPPPLSEGLPLFWVPPLSEANLKNLRAIQIGACKLHETL